MAHPHQNRQGIESITPPIGLPTAGVLLAAFAGFVWLCIKHPWLALTAVAVAVPLALLGGTSSSSAGLLAIVAGVAIAHRSNKRGR